MQGRGGVAASARFSGAGEESPLAPWRAALGCLAALLPAVFPRLALAEEVAVHHSVASSDSSSSLSIVAFGTSDMEPAVRTLLLMPRAEIASASGLVGLDAATPLLFVGAAPAVGRWIGATLDLTLRSCPLGRQGPISFGPRLSLPLLRPPSDAMTSAPDGGATEAARPTFGGGEVALSGRTGAVRLGARASVELPLGVAGSRPRILATAGADYEGTGFTLGIDLATFTRLGLGSAAESTAFRPMLRVMMGETLGLNMGGEAALPAGLSSDWSVDGTVCFFY